MTDVVDRLLHGVDYPDEVWPSTLREAAAEIERLRAALRETALQALADQAQAQDNWDEVQRLRAAVDGLGALYTRRAVGMRQCRHAFDEVCHARRCDRNGCARARDLLALPDLPA